MKRLILFPYTFVLMNVAAVVGLYRFLSKRRDVWSGYNDVQSISDGNREAPSDSASRKSTVEVVHTEQQFVEIREKWTELLALSSSDCIFLTWEWLHTWWTHLGRDAKLHVLVIRNGVNVIAIAPMTTASTTLTRLAHIRALEFLGTGSVGSDYLDIIVRRGREAEAIRILADYFQRERFVLDLKQLDRNRSLALQLAERLQQGRWNRSESRTNVCPYVELAGHTWKSYQSDLGPNHRANFHRRLRNLHREFDVRFERVRSEDSRATALATLVDLHQKRMLERGGSDGLHSSQLVAFHEDMTRLALAQGRLRLFVLKLNDDNAAALYGFMYRKTFYFYQSGFDPRYSRHSVGLVTMGLAIRTAIEEGAEEFDMLHGAEKYKFLWAKKQRDLTRIELFPPTTSAWMYTNTIGISRLARAAARFSLSMLRPPARSVAK